MNSNRLCTAHLCTSNKHDKILLIGDALYIHTQKHNIFACYIHTVLSTFLVSSLPKKNYLRLIRMKQSNKMLCVALNAAEINQHVNVLISCWRTQCMMMLCVWSVKHGSVRVKHTAYAIEELIRSLGWSEPKQSVCSAMIHW